MIAVFAFSLGVAVVVFWERWRTRRAAKWWRTEVDGRQMTAFHPDVLRNLERKNRWSSRR